MDNILIIKHGSLGDIVQISGVLKDIRESYRNSKIFFLTSPMFKSLMDKCPYIDEVLIDDRKVKWKIIHIFKLKKKLSSYNFSHVFDLQNSKRTEIYRRAILNTSNWSSSITILKNNETKKDFDKLEILERFKIQMERSGVAAVDSKSPDFTWAIDNSFEYRNNLSSKYIVLLPFCSKHLPHKKWPYYSELISKFKKNYPGIGVLIAPGPGEIDEALNYDAKVILDDNNPTNFFQLSKVLSDSLYVIANDTGPAHMAAHLGCKGVALFGHHTTSKKVSMKTKNFDILESEDLSKISVDDVYEKILLHLRLEDI